MNKKPREPRSIEKLSEGPKAIKQKLKKVPKSAKLLKDFKYNELLVMKTLTVQEYSDIKKTSRRTIYNNLENLNTISDGKLIKIIWDGKSRRWAPDRSKDMRSKKAKEN